MKCSVIVLQYNHADLTRQCLTSLLAHTDRRHQVILVDNCSTETAARDLGREFPDVTTVASPENGGFSQGNNAGARRATGDILLFLNNDTLIESEFLEPLLKRFEENSATGIVGPRLLNRDGSFQLSAGQLPSVPQEFRDKLIATSLDAGSKRVLRRIERRYRTAKQVGWVTGAALAIRKRVFDAVGGFDESFFMFFEDKDLCARVRAAGYEVWYDPGSAIKHLRGASSNPRTAMIYRKSQGLYYAKHRSPLERLLLNLYLRTTGKLPDALAAIDTPRH